MKDFPLASHQFARKAATASHCAEEQGKFWEMSDAMFADQLKLSPADLLATAQTLGLDADRFKTCVESDKFDPALAKAATDAAAAGVRGVPVFYIGATEPGSDNVKILRILRGARPYADFKSAIDGLLGPVRQGAAE